MLCGGRTPGTGLYANLEKYSIPYPEAIFNIDYFSNNPQPFFSLAKALYPGSHRPNYIHYFIHMLHLKGLLLRMYTQNIDGLEKGESDSVEVDQMCISPTGAAVVRTETQTG